jgi:hypothetical protein
MRSARGPRDRILDHRRPHRLADRPGVFYRLRFMAQGARVYVKRTDGSLAVFRVTAKHMYLKADFPTADVYGPAPTPQLRLITCGGTFDPATGHYLSNVIVFATLIK